MDKKTRKLLLAYISKTANQAEIAQAKAWIAQSAANELAYIHLYQAFHHKLSQQHRIIDEDAAFYRFASERKSSKNRFIKPALQLAASLTLFFAIGLYFYQNSNRTKPETAYVQLQTAKGQKNKMALPDGTLVYLNAGSTLKYDTSFNSTNRTVYLEGEAYFDIAKSTKDLPFIVDAEGYVVRDIGTVFRVKSFKNEKKEFAVLSGAISVENATLKLKKVMLKKNESLKIDAVSKPKAVKSQEKELRIERHPLEEIPVENAYEEWLSGTLSFDNTNFIELSKRLEREFNVEIVADPVLNTYTYSGAFKKMHNVYEVLNIIKQTTPINIVTNRKIIHIKKSTDY
ncbi:hypothetical protein BCY91_12910 [Pelobium manganitolerans]|uniref:Anti-sigma factor n=1 Tax=Pelobium manganitolerans TaxID=1842495 RepID=A0A419SAP2_9SPHI|nr:FecR family protein [Pelobium manganitolerans]RKD19500.1 hypothetical protein BCY91_12910 [Pelobium manganitolerans]